MLGSHMMRQEAVAVVLCSQRAWQCSACAHHVDGWVHLLMSTHGCLLVVVCAAAEALAHPYFSAAPPPTPGHRLPKPPLREDNPLQVREQLQQTAQNTLQR